MESRGGKAVVSVFWSAIGSVGSQVVSFIIFFVLARLLGPKAFGLVGMATVFTDFVGIFADQGLDLAIVQRKDLEERHLDAAFWSNAGTGITLTFLGIILSGTIAHLYHEPQLRLIVVCLSFTFLLSALSSTQAALLKREFNFRDLSIRQLVAGIIGGIAGIVSVFLGAGVYALVIKVLITNFVGMLLLWKSGKWRPRFNFSYKYFGDLYHFGVNMIGVRITNFLRTRLDDFLVGYFLGAEVLGIYILAYRLGRLILDVFSNVIGNVVISKFSRLQNDIEQLKAAFYRTTRLSSLIIFPVFAGSIMFASDLIFLLSGSQWMPAVPIMRILSLAGFTLVLQYINSYTIISFGKPAFLLLINTASTILTAVAFVVSARFGILYVAISYTVVNMVFFGVYLYATHRLIWLKWSDYLDQILPPAMACVIMGLVLFALQELFIENDRVDMIFNLIVGGGVGALVYGFGIAFLRPSLLREVRTLALQVVLIKDFKSEG